jgi:hypothetical protein
MKPNILYRLTVGMEDENTVKRNWRGKPGVGNFEHQTGKCRNIVRPHSDMAIFRSGCPHQAVGSGMKLACQGET